jgi:hypothetical protein
VDHGRWAEKRGANTETTVNALLGVTAIAVAPVQTIRWPTSPEIVDGQAPGIQIDASNKPLVIIPRHDLLIYPERSCP